MAGSLKYKISVPCVGSISGKTTLFIEPEYLSIEARPKIKTTVESYFFEYISTTQEIFDNLLTAVKKKKNVEKATNVFDNDDNFKTFMFGLNSDLTPYISFEEDETFTIAVSDLPTIIKDLSKAYKQWELAFDDSSNF